MPVRGHQLSQASSETCYCNGAAGAARPISSRRIPQIDTVAIERIARWTSPDAEHWANRGETRTEMEHETARPIGPAYLQDRHEAQQVFLRR
ncbi:hypothetical protein GCM10023147_03870 [Tsukamurella soli]|uniref:Uncharacterized protein n=1 Tax=Tsukamurella soli TaxID=644556 RepID=A0ABP8J2Q1_9ACTN